MAAAGEQDDGPGTGDQAEAGAFVLVDREHAVRPVHIDVRARLPFRSALEQNENGWEVTENGDLPIVIHANWPGSKRMPS
ncbi:hypothetical protein [Kribbella sp. NPDC050470]|uniref:hypothetical protein n=1 Tax=unclassified Kribbella TaxID=2644121 RepID=UPI0037967B2E